MNLLKKLRLEKFEKKLIYVIIITIFVLLNALLSTIPLRLDLSYGKAYTLSDATKKIVRNIQKPVDITFYVSQELPSRLQPLKLDVNDLLTEYKREGKINVRSIDPKRDDKSLQDAKEKGIPELQFSQVEQDQYAVTTAYFGIVIEHEKKREVIPQVTDIGSLEYNLSAAVYKLTRKTLPKVGVIGNGAASVIGEDSLSTLKGVLGQQFAIEQINVSSASAEYQTLLVFDDNAKSYTQGELNSLKNYIQKGGKAIFFVDGVWVSDNMQTTEAKHNLFNFFKGYGITLNKNFVLSAAAEIVNFGTGSTNFLTPYPLWIKTNNFNTKSSYFANIVQLTFPWTSSVSLNSVKNTQTKELIKSMERSWEQKKDFTLDPQSVGGTQISEFKEYIVGAESMLSNGGKIIVIPSSRFVQERFLGQSDNIGLVLNIVNDLASQGALSGMRQRAVNIVPLPQLSPNQQDIFKYLNILLLPAIFGIYGALRLVRRK